MRWRSIAPGGWGLVFLLLCMPALARGTHDVHGGNCVAYARDVTGVRLDGNAASWWPHAEGRYERGHKPEVGAILVFKPYGRMHVGHVAVVSRVVNSREVLVDQANWVRGRVTKAMSVVDASPLNDWTSVKVQYQGTHGRQNPTYGFIYPNGQPADFGPAIAAAAPGRAHADRADRLAARGRHHKNDATEEVAAADGPPRHVAERHRHHRDDPTQEAAAKNDPPPRHVAGRHKHHKDTDEQEAAAQPDPAPRHAAHHKNRAAQDTAKAAPPEQPTQQLAAARLPVHKHKGADAKLAYVY